MSAVVTDDEYARVNRLVRAGVARSVAELVRKSVRDYAAKAGVVRLLTLDDVPLPAARRAVERYLKQHPGVVWPDEMAEKLGIDYRIVLNVVNQLLSERKVEYPKARTEVIEV